jgi:hypothetical protein
MATLFRLQPPSGRSQKFRIQQNTGDGWRAVEPNPLATINELLANGTLTDSQAKQRCRDILLQYRANAKDQSTMPILSPGNHQIVANFLAITYPAKVKIKRISEDSLRTLKYDMAHMLNTLGEIPIEGDNTRLQNHIDKELRDNPSRHIKTITCLNRIRASMQLQTLRYLPLNKEDIVYLSEEETERLIEQAPEPYKTLIGVAF